MKKSRNKHLYPISKNHWGIEKTASTPHLDAWVQQTLQRHVEIQEWCQQFKASHKRSEAPVTASQDGGVSHSDPQKLLPAARQLAGDLSTSFGTTAAARLDELLEILWADVNLWQCIRDADSPFEISYYISQKHGLRFPEIPVAVWIEIGSRPKSRDYLFRLHRDHGEIQLDGASDFYIVGCALQSKLPPESLGSLFWNYLSNPALDHRHIIAALRLSPDQLETMRLAATKFASELKWCAGNPNIVPPPLASNPKHRAGSVERARAIEAMVTKLLINPSLSNYRLAGSSSANPKDTELKIAAAARQLVELREGKPVARYSARRNGRTIGHKPPSSP